jgi:hypothetical protein
MFLGNILSLIKCPGVLEPNCLSVEAIANTIGELLVPDFKDFESSSPKAKIRIICETIGLEFKRDEPPFIDVIHLLKIRNQLAHPKYQRLHYESKEMPLAQAQKHYQETVKFCTTLRNRFHLNL